MYSIRDGKEIQTIQTIEDAEAQITHVMFIANSQLMAVVSLDGTITIYEKKDILPEEETTERKQDPAK